MIKGLFLDIGDTIIMEEEGKSLNEMSGNLVEGAAEFLEEMSRRFQLVIVSNTVNSYAVDIDQLLVKLGLRRYFQHIITSLDVGIAKPEPGIFEEALRVSGLKPGEVIMIGDRVDTDILGANRMNICSVLLRWRDRHPLQLLTQKHKPSFIARSLAEIRDYIDSRT
ncbi:MAG: HAD family hydrolase [Candidatus Omnitrophica bacterium]|nr:HAD family hydrolase [Candidatus Omnitrophota bacterium]